MKRITDLVYRQYLAMARQESFTPSEIGETFLDAPTVQKNWFEPENVSEALLAKGAIRKPSKIENLVYCAELRRIHGKRLDAIPQFEKGILQLPKYDGLLIPQRSKGLIFELHFER